MLGRYNQTQKSWRKSYYKPPIHKRRSFYFLVFLLIIAIGFVYWSINPGPQILSLDKLGTGSAQDDNKESKPNNGTAAKLVFLDGTAESKIGNAENWEAVNVNFELTESTSIKTGASSRAVIELQDNSFIRLGQNTEIKLAEISLTDAVIEQHFGHAYHRVNDNTPLIYRVQHGPTEFTALGTAFDIKIVGQTSELITVANEVKVKVMDSDESILALETIEQGKKVNINPNLEESQMIKQADFGKGSVIASEWFLWNKKLDENQDFFLGILGKILQLKILEPTGGSAEVVDEEFLIKGETDPNAEIFINGNKITNESGAFEFNALLKEGENDLIITAQKDQNQAEKTVKITYTPETEENLNGEEDAENDAPEEVVETLPTGASPEHQEQITNIGSISLSGSIENNTANLSWTASGVEIDKGYKILMNGSGSPTFPDSAHHLILGTELTGNAPWTNLQAGETYYFRVCQSTVDGCGMYSNEILLTNE